MRYHSQNRQPFTDRFVHPPGPPIQRQIPYNPVPPFQQAHPLKQLAKRGFDGLGKTLHHVQTVANMLESAGPMIEKYKPVVKNLPMMLQMLKAMKSAEDTEQTNTSLPTKDNIKQQADERQGISKPKLYIE